MTCKLLEKVSNTIKTNDLFDNIKTICVGVSGGADSICLLDVLYNLKEKFCYELTVVHVNHMIRGDEAERDASFVEDFCNSKNIKFVLVKDDIPKIAKQTGETLEECGRRIRYKAFAKTNCDAIAVAHTLSDSIETSLFNLSRGTGIKGACGISVKRDNIIRPLIDCTRDDVVAYCEQNGLSYVTDSTNLSDDYTRNFVRHQIVTRFKEMDENFESNYKRFIETSTLDNDFIDECANKLIASSKTERGFSAEAFLSSHKSVSTRALYYIIKEACKETADSLKVNLLYKMLLDGKGEIELSKGLYVTVRNNEFFIHNKEITESVEFDVKETDLFFETPVGTYKLISKSDSSDCETQRKNLIDFETIKGKLHIRNRREGDKFSSPIRKNTKSLKKLFNEMSIESCKRDKIAILCDEIGIVWIEGIGTDSRCAVNDKTKKFIYLVKEVN